MPSESTFFRAFAEFAKAGLGERVHAALVEKYVRPGLVGHISRDATAIQGREKARAKTRSPKPATRKKGHPRRGEVREPQPETRLQRQSRQSAAEALAELPQYCDKGMKKNAKGDKERWIGYKLHAGSMTAACPSVWR